MIDSDAFKSCVKPWQDEYAKQQSCTDKPETCPQLKDVPSTESAILAYPVLVKTKVFEAKAMLIAGQAANDNQQSQTLVIGTVTGGAQVQKDIICAEGQFVKLLSWGS